MMDNVRKYNKCAVYLFRPKGLHIYNGAYELQTFSTYTDVTETLCIGKKQIKSYSLCYPCVLCSQLLDKFCFQLAMTSYCSD
jgi:hypothetical protein